MKPFKTKSKVFLIIFIFLIVWIFWSNTTLSISKYIISDESVPSEFNGFKIAHISDLHNAEIGKGNKNLLANIKEENPDIIVITGDIIDRNNTDTAVAINFAEAASKIAPCFYVNGNHEASVNEYNDFKKALKNVGITVLEDDYSVIDKNGQKIYVLGLSDPSFSGGRDITSSLKHLKEAAGSNYTILLSHRPELFELYSEYEINLVFSGHAHGGQFRLPFIGGLIAPNQGLFPKYDSGLYTEETTSMIVSRGIGNSIIPIRINNRPNLGFAELKLK